eukprot:CAMPEP_0118705786 /NCGR_PEP_ID=MMETSP0800-20121206/20093_1 /TAXON_ID=210618 ORGANISM="Striatella unipunctata, Strain CCMP2910" /NCGR_SAMPLE_ID=MMETSP0800 /ASSEMBLY_ACC=CAM_ASM_000638 /LENGTH=108 /DNA_ID=CAMNT_0006608043 /DNA_START=298 /DNA_END=621 /DNA_ORIENTATION=-
MSRFLPLLAIATAVSASTHKERELVASPTKKHLRPYNPFPPRPGTGKKYEPATKAPSKAPKKKYASKKTPSPTKPPTRPHKKISKKTKGKGDDSKRCTGDRQVLDFNT